MTTDIVRLHKARSSSRVFSHFCEWLLVFVGSASLYLQIPYNLLSYTVLRMGYPIEFLFSSLHQADYSRLRRWHEDWFWVTIEITNVNLEHWVAQIESYLTYVNTSTTYTHNKGCIRLCRALFRFLSSLGYMWPICRSSLRCFTATGAIMIVALQLESSRNIEYHQLSNLSRALVSSLSVDHSDVNGASPVGAAITTSSFSTWHLASIYCSKTREKHLSFGIWCGLC